MISLIRLLEREELNQTSRFERYTAELLRIIASGKHIDEDRTPTFGYLVEDLHRNPFEKQKEQPKTAEDIKAYMLRKIRKLQRGE